MTLEALRKRAEQNRAMLGVSSRPQATSDDIANRFPPSAIRVGTGGTVVFDDADHYTNTWPNVPDGAILDVLVTLVRTTDTTASDFHRIT